MPRSVHQIALATLLLVGILYGCANKLPPGGGPYDETPPKMLRSRPINKALNATEKKVVLYFDEYIKLEDPSKKVIVSPPQLKNPKIMAIGKKVVVELYDELIQNTTYSLDFTDAIVDNNEGNPLENFSFAFSTGNEIDTMEVSGTVLAMRNHEPMQGITVGIHPAEAGWNAFTDTTFLRMSRTSDKAFFVMRNIKQGSYRIYALKEADGNYRHDMPTEGIAFMDSIITTSSMPALRNDTIWVDSLTIDTIKQVKYTRYMPDDLVLMYSEPISPRRYISKRERPDSMRLHFEFNLPIDEGPWVLPIDTLSTPDSLGNSYLIDKMEDGKVDVFFTNPAWKSYDRFEVSYYSVDTLMNRTMVRDTISLKTKAKALAQDDRKKEKNESNDSISVPKKESPFTVKVEHKGVGGIKDSIIFITSLPIDTTAFAGIELFNANDSILKPVPIKSISFLPNRTTAGLITADLSYNTSYELYFDSLKFTDVMGHHLNETAIEAFKTKPKDEFSHLQITIQGVNGPYIAELLNLKDEPIRVISSANPVFNFRDLKPDKYGFRLIIDKNNNGIWDCGNYKDSIQPEQVYYAPKIFELMKNWEVKETLNPLETPIAQQKPKELIKNKPKEKKKRDLNKEREEELKRRREGGQQNPMGGIGGRGLGGLGRGGLQTDRRM